MEILLLLQEFAMLIMEVAETRASRGQRFGLEIKLYLQFPVAAAMAVI